MVHNFGGFVASCAGFLLFLMSPAYAYLDPGTGSIMVQAILGTIAGATAVIGLYWRKVKAFFSGKSGSDSEDHKDTADG